MTDSAGQEKGGQPSLKGIEMVCCGQRMIPLYEGSDDGEQLDELFVRCNCSICGGNYLSSIARVAKGDSRLTRLEAAREGELFLQVLERRQIGLEKRLSEAMDYLHAIWKETRGLKKRLAKQVPARKGKKR